MNNIQPIETEYNGYKFRSRLEARWAVFFDALGIKYEYEPEGMRLSNGTCYLPDFYLISMNCYFEVKRKGIKETEDGKIALRKIRSGMESDSWAGIICFGDPMDDDLIVFCQEVDDSGAGSYTSRITIGKSIVFDEVYLIAYDDHRRRDYYDSFETMNRIPITLGSKYEPDLVNSTVLKARKFARQVRFEYGQTPKVTYT